MELLIDNYDSFTYNLYQQIGQFTTDIIVKKNDEIDCAAIERLKPKHIIISPGPGRPSDAGNCVGIVNKFAGRIPILGVCMGLEVIAVAFNTAVVLAPKLMHGKVDTIKVKYVDEILNGVPQKFQAARYHSLIADYQQLPANFKITSVSSDNELMSFSDSRKHIYAIQYHPESIMTDSVVGNTIIQNFLKV
ncbi:aminodeoxychorismate/anthranilate synthase component II [Lactobacillus sp. UCMA15818]|uniref:anthranilate synthase component II n=1 Tax=Lactobacillaceae TaxID=33958 RepID=UPI0025B0CCD0|nr:aminodeoxychorismate/anthranilate synthase component II [Lactobacillus sp. UCMA15818]MDN2453962.1 aminodeoxychorismate/anthranilate synthase component II [Lactobacillus sp. UCMA15818]